MNVAASVRQRLLNLSRKRREDFQFILTRYVAERFLYRLSKSDHSKDLVLKGATLFYSWTGQLYRPTRDLDFLGYGENSSFDDTKALIAEICETSVEDDGLKFDLNTIRVEQIREPHEYQGHRVTVKARLDRALVHLQIDIGFGDVIIPKSESVAYPTFLDMPSPKLTTYPKETVVAEKLQAVVALGIANSRFKDYYDLLVIARDFSFEGETLTTAISSTFERRKTPVPEKIPLGLTQEFAEAPGKIHQWGAFLSSHFLDAGISFTEVLYALEQFLLAPLAAASLSQEFKMKWPAGGPWQKHE